jgi:hypothetical protein
MTWLNSYKIKRGYVSYPLIYYEGRLYFEFRKHAYWCSES